MILTLTIVLALARALIPFALMSICSSSKTSEWTIPMRRARRHLLRVRRCRRAVAVRFPELFARVPPGLRGHAGRARGQLALSVVSPARLRSQKEQSARVPQAAPARGCAHRRWHPIGAAVLRPREQRWCVWRQHGLARFRAQVKKNSEGGMDGGGGRCLRLH